MREDTIIGGLRKGSRWAAILGGLLILLCSVLITIDVLGRLTLNRVLVQSFEVSRYLFAVAVAASFALAAVDKAHIRIDIVVGMLSTRWRAILGVIAMASLALVAGYFAWRGYTVAALSAQINARPVSGLNVPLWLPQSGWVLALAWFALVCVVMTLIGVAMLFRRDWEKADLIFGTPSVEEEIDLATESGDAGAAGDTEGKTQ